MTPVEAVFMLEIDTEIDLDVLNEVSWRLCRGKHTLETSQGIQVFSVSDYFSDAYLSLFTGPDMQ